MGTAISKEIFAPYIVEKLRKTNPFLQHAYSVDKENILAGAVVHIPQAGAKATVVKNRSSFPATAKQRGDSHVTYALDVFSTDPTHVSWDESHSISYNKTDSVLNDHVATLAEAVGDNMLYCWVRGHKRGTNGALTEVTIPTANIVNTSGNAVDVNDMDGQTGKRKAFTEKDLARAAAKMNKANVPHEGRYCIIESDMYNQLIDSLSANVLATFQQTVNLAEGVLGKLHGFNIMMRSSVLRFDASGKPKAPDAANAETDNLAALCWQKDCVENATGETKPFSDIDSPQYYGDVFSALVKSGGRARREDFAGVVAIVQAAEATEATAE